MILTYVSVFANGTAVKGTRALSREPGRLGKFFRTVTPGSSVPVGAFWPKPPIGGM